MYLPIVKENGGGIPHTGNLTYTAPSGNKEDQDLSSQGKVMSVTYWKYQGDYVRYKTNADIRWSTWLIYLLSSFRSASQGVADDRFACFYLFYDEGVGTIKMREIYNNGFNLKIYVDNNKYLNVQHYDRYSETFQIMIIT